MTYGLVAYAKSIDFGDFCGDPSGNAAFQSIHRLTAGFRSDVGITSQHGRAHMTHHIKHRRLRYAILRQLGTEKVPQVVKQAFDARFTVSQAVFKDKTGLVASTGRVRFDSGKTYHSGCRRTELPRAKGCVLFQRRSTLLIGIARRAPASVFDLPTMVCSVSTST